MNENQTSYELAKEMMSTLARVDHRSYVKAILSIEMSIDNEEILDAIIDEYYQEDDMVLVNPEFDYVIQGNEREFIEVYP